MTSKEPLKSYRERILKVQYTSGQRDIMTFQDKKNRDNAYYNILEILKTGSPTIEIGGIILLLPNVEFIKKGEIR